MICIRRSIRTTSNEDQQWLGIMTPFSGLTVLSRSDQGLLGQSEELDEPMAKILATDIKEGRAVKIQDIIIGDTQLEAATNYIKILQNCILPTSKLNLTRQLSFPKPQTLVAGSGRKEASFQCPHIVRAPY